MMTDAPEREKYIVSIKLIYAILLAILPVIQMYKAPFISLGLSTALLILFTPYALIKAFYMNQFKIRLSSLLLILLLFGVYAISRSGNDYINILAAIITVIYVFAASNGVCDLKLARKVIEIIALLACALIFIQYISYYLLHRHITLINANLVIDSIKNYSSLLSTGISNGIYRPSALFLEPAHFSQYVIVALISTLLANKIDKKTYFKAIILSLGMIMTTSGLGIALTAAAWGWFVISRQDIRKGRKFKNIVVILLLGTMAFFIMLQFSFFSNALQRIFGQLNGYNAIQGRFFFTETYISNFSITQKIFGVGYDALTDNRYLTSIITLYFYTGIVGCVSYYLILLKGFLHTKGFSRCLAISYAGMLIFCNLTSLIGMVFYLSLIYAAYDNNSTKSHDNKYIASISEQKNRNEERIP